VKAVFPDLHGGPVSAETPSFYEGKSVFLLLGRPSFPAIRILRPPHDPTATTGARLFPSRWEQAIIRELAVLQLRPSGKTRIPLKPLLALAPGDWAAYGYQRNREAAFHKTQ
jgi:hypothetical protein